MARPRVVKNMFGKIIFDLNITERDLAFELDVRERTIFNWINNPKIITIENVEKISQFTKIERGYLMEVFLGHWDSEI